jgi:hypothetical protein
VFSRPADARVKPRLMGANHEHGSSRGRDRSVLFRLGSAAYHGLGTFALSRSRRQASPASAFEGFVIARASRLRAGAGRPIARPARQQIPQVERARRDGLGEIAISPFDFFGLLVEIRFPAHERQSVGCDPPP